MKFTYNLKIEHETIDITCSCYPNEEEVEVMELN